MSKDKKKKPIIPVIDVDATYNKWYETLSGADKKFVDVNFPPPSNKESRKVLEIQALVKFSNARNAIIFNKAFFGNLILKPHELVIWPDKWEQYHFNNTLGPPPPKTICISDSHFIFNPVWINQIDIKELCAYLVDLILKPALLHVQRCSGREIQRWNMASDCVTADITKDALKIVPETIKNKFVEEFQGKNCETIYSLLPETPPQPQSGDGDEDGDGEGSLSDIMGEGSGGMAPALNPKESMERSMSTWMGHVCSAIAGADKSRGLVPAGIRQMIEELLQSKVSWQKYLCNFLVSSSNKTDYSSSRYNRNYMHRKLYLPALHKETLGEGVVIIDTSGSCGEYQEQFLSETAAVLTSGDGVELLRIVAADAFAVHEQDWEIFGNPPQPIALTGGGGTSFVPAFELIRDLGWQPDFVIYLTDMYGDFPENDLNPGCPVLWMSTTPLEELDMNQVHFGTACHMEL